MHGGRSSGGSGGGDVSGDAPPLPAMPWLRFKRVSVSSGGVKQMTSSTRPLNIPCRVVDGTARNAGAAGEASSVVRLLYKKEDVRKDAIVMNCLRVMERILGERRRF